MENAKIHELFKCIQHSQLQDTVRALKVKLNLEGLTYMQAANHLAPVVSELPEHQMAVKVSQVGAARIHGFSNNENKGKRNGIHMLDSSVFMGYYHDWKDLSQRIRTRLWQLGRKAVDIPKAGRVTSRIHTRANAKLPNAKLSPMLQKNWPQSRGLLPRCIPSQR